MSDVRRPGAESNDPGVARGWRPASMKRRPAKQLVTDAFDIVRTVGLTLPDVEATTKYDGSPVLKVDGIFMAGLAMHPSAEPDTLVVRAGLEDRERLVEDAPETCYLTDYYRSYPIVLVRLSRVEPDALHDLLSVSWRMTTAKARRCARRWDVADRSNRTRQCQPIALGLPFPRDNSA